MKYSLQAKGFLCLTYPTPPSSRFGIFSLPFLLILALYFLVPANMTAAPLDAATTATTTTKRLTIKNNGNCTVRVYHWLASGDVFKKELKAGASWSVNTERGQMWRVINTNPVWKSLKYDEHFTVGNNNSQTWTVKPTYCEGTTPACGAELEHFSAVAETACNRNDGKIITDPHINAGTVLPYYIEYSFNGSKKKHGPYAKNQDNYITGLAAGTYKDLTIIDAKGCTKNHGDVTVKKADCQTVEPTCGAELSLYRAVAETGCNSNDGKIITNPDVSEGTVLPYYIEYSFNGSKKKHGPYAKNIDNYITGLAAGTYSNLTIIDANGCTKNHGNVTVKKADCQTVQPTCGAELSRFSAVAETGCNSNDGKIITNPDVSEGTVLPYYIEYSFNGSKKKHGPYARNIDNYITNLAAGTYKDLTIIDANGCTKNHGDITVEKANCVVTPPTPPTPECNLKVNAGDDQQICAGQSVTLTSTISGESDCSFSCCTREVSNTNICFENRDNVYAFYLTDGEENRSFRLTNSSDVRWEECTDGELRYSATNLEATDGSGEVVSIEFVYKGRTTTMPNGEHKEHSCLTNYRTDGWIYYPEIAGTIKSNKNGTYTIKRKGPAFQMGYGANVTSNTLDYGACNWFDIVSGNGRWTAGDINIMLSETCNTSLIADPAPTQYNWSTGANTASIDVSAAGTYSVTATDCNGCTATDEVVITSDNSTITVNANGTIDCANTNVKLRATGADIATYNWSGPNGFSATEAAPSVSTAGTYKLIATTAGGCEVEASVRVEGDASVPSITATVRGGAKITCTNTSVDLNVSGAMGAYEWSGPEGFVSTSANPIVEAAGTYSVVVLAANGCQASASVEVEKDCQPKLSINDVIVNEEDGTATLEICLDNIATEFVYVRYGTTDDSAQQGRDYKQQSNYAFIPEGKQCTEVVFNIIDDNKEETDEIFKVILSSPFNADLGDEEGMVTILDTDSPTCDTKGGRITGGPFEFCVGDGNADNIATGAIRTSGNAGANTQWVVTDGTGTTILGLPNNPSDVDFDGAGTGACLIWYLSHDGSLTGAAEGALVADLQGCFSLSNSITVNRVECNEPTLSISDVVVNEEDGIATLEVCLDQPTTEFVYVRYTTSDDSAIANRDYKGQSSYAFLAEGEQCKTIEFDIINDDVVEEDETFVVSLSTPYNAVISDGEGLVTILDTDAPVVMIPDPELAIDDVVVFEDEGLAILIICSDAVSTSPITVYYNTKNETAEAGDDYQETGGSVTIPVGMNCTEIELPIIDDKDDERDEVFVVELSDPSNAIIADAFGTVTILDNDEAIVIQPIELPLLTITDVTVNENEGYAHLEICLDQPAVQEVRVDCITADGTAVEGIDYLQTEDVAIIPVGETCTQASFKILDDSNAEETEIYYVNLSNASNAIIADDQGTITILDDDEIETVICPDTDVYSEDGNITVSGMDAPIEVVQIFNTDFEVVFQCRGEDCEATEVIENLPLGEYNVKIKSYTSSWDLICIEETKVTVLDENTPPAPLTCLGNITNGGRIGGEESFCGTYNPTLITSEIAAAGGADSRDIEYLWLASTVDCPSEIEDQIPGATSATYDPGPITETTYFVRCSRRLGCTVWVESNCIVKDVFCPNGSTPEGNEGNTPPAQGNLVEACGDVNILYGNGQIEMIGRADEKYHFQVNAIDQEWATVLACVSDCGHSQTATDLIDGRYLVTIYDANWNKLCQVEVALASGLTNDIASSRNRIATSNTTLKTTKQVDKTFTETNRTVIEGVTQANFKQAQKTDISFYPNPVRDLLTVDLSALAGQEGKAYLSNQMGQVVKTLDLGVIDANPIQIQMGLLSNGLYHLTIVAEGQLVATEKIMVQQY